MGMKKRMLSILGLAMAFLLTSCLEYKTEITLNKDGSGTITEETVFGAQVIGMLEMAAAQGGETENPLTELKDEAKAKAKAKTYGEGVTLEKIEEVKRDGGKGVKVTYKFTDINKITFNPGGSLGDMAPGEEAVERVKEEEAKFEYADGKLTIILPQPEKEDGEEGAKDDGDAADELDPQAAIAMQMMRGMKMSATLTAAPAIAETDATYHEGNTITLFEVDFNTIMDNPEGMKALQKLDMKDQAKTAEVLGKIKGVKAEAKEKVTLTIK